MAEELTTDQINELLAGAATKRRGGGPRDTTEPRTLDNWWKQNHNFVDTSQDPEMRCGNINCKDDRPDERIKILILLKGRLCCRFCFLDGWLSGKEYNE